MLAKYKFEFFQLDGVLRVRMSQTGDENIYDSPIPSVAAVFADPEKYWREGRPVIIPLPIER
jgi:hypothetical protein